MSDVIIRCRKNGPLIVTGPVRLTDAEGNEYDLGEKENIALCRCGVSETRPFCDGTHRETGFQTDESAAKSQTDRS